MDYSFLGEADAVEFGKEAVLGGEAGDLLRDGLRLARLRRVDQQESLPPAQQPWHLLLHPTSDALGRDGRRNL